MKRTLLIMAVMLAMVATLAIAGGEQEGAAAEEGGEELYVFLPKSLDNPYWDECRIGMEDQADMLNVRAEFLGPPTADAAEQVKIFESVMARNPNGIAVSPNNPSTVEPVIKAAMDAGIPVIAWDSDVPGSERIAYVGTDNEAAGRFAGEELAKVLDGSGTVAILHGSLSADNAIARVNGLEQALSNYPDIEIVATEPTDESPATALAKAESLLQAYPDLDAFFGVTGVGVPGAGNAVVQAGKTGDVKVVGFDVVPQGVELMRQGAVQALISQRPYGMTQQALEMLYAIDKGDMPEKEIYDTGVVAVYPEELENFLETHH